MPWRASDAKRHKAGLTPKQAQTWAKIANESLARCQSDNGSDCEGRAIRIANSAVGKSMEAQDLALVLEAPISKSDDARQQIFGWASIAVRKDGHQIEDLQGDLIDIDELEAAWYEYVLESGELNVLHKGACQGQLIEAIVFTPEKLEALGLPADSLPLGAWVGFHVEDSACYQMIKSQGFVMFSIEGSAIREAV